MTLPHLRNHSALLIAAIVVCAAAVLFTPLRGSNVILAEGNWGAGPPQSSVLTGFAVLGPWWRPYRPSGVVQAPDGAVEPVVRVPRASLRAKRTGIELPHRSIGYDFVLGGFTMLRSVGSDEIVYDWRSIVRGQQVLLVLALLAPMFALVGACAAPWRGVVALAYSLVFALLQVVQPFENRWLIDGVIDSALSAPAALLAVPILVALGRCGRHWSWPRALAVVLCGMGLGSLTMIRGELAIVFMFTLAVMATWPRPKATIEGPEHTERRILDRSASRLAERWWVVVASVALLSVPVTYGFLNLAIHGHFVPFRLQAGQNLVEPVGEFENPWGIVYTDVWMSDDLAARGIEYVSFEADAVLTRQYVQMLGEAPGLFVRNFAARLVKIPGELGYGLLGLPGLPFLLGVAIWWGRRDDEARAALVPLVLAIGIVVFHAWFGSPSRVLAPARFLTAAAMCGLLALGMQRLWARRQATRILRRPKADPEPGASATGRV